MPDFAKIKGNKIDDIEVSISYRIIELFSAGLYSSPNKAFEELICNSYDAMADKVSVYFTPDLAQENAFIWICDNGEGLDEQELKDLWRIGESSKRNEPENPGERLQIGQFGIGKLATYILAQNLTYITKKNSKYLLASMDYSKITKATEKVYLDEIEIEEGEAKRLVNNYTLINGKNMVDFEMFGDNASETWTISILTNLKGKATEIQEGRLRWLLRTALPLNPQFNLFLNRDKIESAKFNLPIHKQWIVGKDDLTANELDFVESRYDKEANRHYVNFPSLKDVYGEFVLYQDSLVSGKSSEHGRSHGIFLMIRERLINLDDPLLGMEPFSHGPFNRCRIIIYADGLDDNLTSTRESVKDSKPLKELKAYIKKKFNNEVRKFYFEQENAREQKKSISYRVSQTAYSTSQKPIHSFIQQYYNNTIENPILILKPKLDKEELLKKYRWDEEDGGKVIENIEWRILDSQAPIAKLDLEEKTVYVNSLHPYIANYSDSYKNSLPLENLVITEVLMEAYLYEIGLDEVIINSIIRMRDSSLRQLALSDRDGIPAVAMLLRDSVSDATGLEDAVYRAFLALGFETNKIGGNGKPDGYANAALGYTADGVSKSYSLTYDAKSTAKKSIAAGTAKLSGLNRHKEDYKATFAVEVAIDYAGADDEDSAITKESLQQKITVMRVKDLARLILYAAPKQLGLEKLRDLFETCYSPAQVTEWVDNLVAEQPEQGPYYDIIDVVYQLQHDDDAAPTIEVVRMKVNDKLKKKYTVANMKSYAEVLRTIIPGQFHFDDKYVHVDCSPELMKGYIGTAINSEIPVTMREIYNAMFKEED